jgi:predicted transcriptional regulator
MWVISLIEVGKNISSSHRGNFAIIADILGASHGGVKKTYLMYHCNLSFKQMKSYSRFLINAGLLYLDQGNGDGLFEVTEKGRSFLKAYESLVSLMK